MHPWLAASLFKTALAAARVREGWAPTAPGRGIRPGRSLETSGVAMSGTADP
eukprot:SAG31_NODE_25084_length_468_cov_0.840108_1_plen_51_part_10